MHWKSTVNKYSKYFLPISILIFSIYLIKLQLLKPLGWDEMEHIHSTYLISLGQSPYVDFFQHHHAFMWYLFSPILSITNESVESLIVFKFIGIAFGFINLFLIYRLARHFVKSKYIQLIAVLICASSYFFLQNGFEYRPDNLMYSFVIISLDLILSQKKYWPVYSGLTLGFAMVVLQKAIIFVPMFVVVILILNFKIENLENWKIVTRRILESFNFRILKFLFFLVLPNFLFFTLYFSLGQWPEYLFFNWTLNSVFDDKFSAFRTISQMEWFNQGFLIILCLSIIYCLYNLFRNAKFRIQNAEFIILLFLLFACIFLLLTFIRSPYSQYFLPLSLFGSILIANFFEKTLNYQLSTIHFRLSPLPFLILALLLLPIYFYKSESIQNYNFDRQFSDIARDNLLTNEERKNLPVQQNNILFDTKEFYWFSPEAERTISNLEKNNKVPESIPTPKN